MHACVYLRDNDLDEVIGRHQIFVRSRSTMFVCQLLANDETTVGLHKLTYGIRSVSQSANPEWFAGILRRYVISTIHAEQHIFRDQVA